jgi:predicted Fe-S protein YdhL (DUF1289 family)
MTDATPLRPASPCIGACSIDRATGFCRGCRRTLDEIAAWPTMGEGERAAVWAMLPARG